MKKLFLFFALVFAAFANAQSQLCPSTSTNFCCEYVASITINGQTYQGNTGFSGPGFYDYTGTPVPNIKAGDQISISYTVTTNGPYRQYFKFWFDFNGNGDLSDAGELVHSYDETISNTTKTFNNTFTVPTSVFNGEVYMRFIMVFSNSPTLCGNYAYGNTFDFKTNISGAVQPPQYFSHRGSIYDANGSGLSGVDVDLYKKGNSQSTYSLHSTSTTDTSGQYEIVTSLDTTDYDFQIRVPQFNPLIGPGAVDATYFNQKILDADFVSADYYQGDVNRSSQVTIADIYSIYQKSHGALWKSGVPGSLFFTPSEWSSVSAGTANLVSTIPGSQSVIINDPISSDTTNFYLIRTGFKN